MSDDKSIPKEEDKVFLPDEAKEGLNLEQRIAVEKLARAFPAGVFFCDTGGRALAFNAGGPNADVLFAVATQAVAQYLETMAQAKLKSLEILRLSEKAKSNPFGGPKR